MQGARNPEEGKFPWIFLHARTRGRHELNPLDPAGLLAPGFPCQAKATTEVENKEQENSRLNEQAD